MSGGLTFGRDFISRLERIRVLARRASLAGNEGERAGRRKGGVVEFSGHRDYVPGDDLRYLDWNAFGRFGKLSVKEFLREDRIEVNIAVDLSASMGFGGKDDFALRAAAALACITVWGRSVAAIWSIHGGDASGPASFDSGSPPSAILDHLASLQRGGATMLEAAVRKISKSAAKGAMLVLISDLMSPDRYLDAIASAASAGTDVAVLHVLSPAERRTDARGMTALRDSETGEIISIPVDEAAAAMYSEAAGEFVDELREFAVKRGMRYVFSLSDAPVEDLLLLVLTRHGWLGFA